jgi:hypothetical protein
MDISLNYICFNGVKHKAIDANMEYGAKHQALKRPDTALYWRERSPG